ncbi:MAG: translation initiation factor IF-3 [Actinobacteria bacterium]|nr:translation initiation factor IF-3 [Actinomycetota bacterium]
MGGIISTSEPRINDRIRVPQVRLIGFDGEQVGVVDIDAALKLADEVGLDLVEIAPDAQPPVCKVMDFGKYKYEIAQKAREARQNQTHIVVKEMRLRPKIEPHDYETKRNHIEKFLKGGDKVKVTIQFRGREQARPEIGYRLLMKLAEELSEVAFVEFAPKQEGRSMTMVLGTNVKKGQSAAQQKTASKNKSAEKKKDEPKILAEEVVAVSEDN